MTLLAPLFLIGLAAVAVPVIIHLIQRDRKDVVRFPSLMFLDRIPYRSVRRQTIRNWPLFLIRAAAFVLLALAFSRPFLGRDVTLGTGDDGPREVVILLDRSYSMGYGDRMDRAGAEVREVVASLRPEDRGSLVVFSADATTLRRSVADPAPLLQALDETQVGAGVTRFGPALKAAEAILEQSRLPVREVVMISDFQASGWNGDEDIALPEGTRFTSRPVLDDECENVMVGAVTFRRESLSGRERVTATARVTNLGTAPLSGVEVRLEIDDRDLQGVRVDLGEAGSATATGTVEFEPFILSERDTRGTIRVEADPLPADDAYHFVLSPGGGIGVLVVEPRPTRQDASLYLTRALALGEEPGFDVRTVRLDRLEADDFQGRAVVILNGAGAPSGSALLGLRRFVEEGGGVLVALDERSAWPETDLDLLPGAFGRPMIRNESRGGALGFLDTSHPALSLFATPRSGDFTSASIFRYRPITPDSGATVLARFDDGQVALAERRVGEGRVLVWATGLDNFWNDLALRPVYLPFVHALTMYLAGNRGTPEWLTVDQVVDLASVYAIVMSEEGPEPWMLLSPDGEQETLAPGEEGQLFTRFASSGFYEIRPEGNADARRFLGVNADRAESNLTVLDTEEFAAQVLARTGGSGLADAEADAIGLEARERRQSLWWYLLCGAFVLLLADTVLSNRVSMRSA